MTPILASIVGPPCVATSRSASIAACHSSTSNGDSPLGLGYRHILFPPHITNDPKDQKGGREHGECGRKGCRY
jgi:hypothetical protein